MTHERSTERGRGRHDLHPLAPFLDGAQQVRFGVAVALVTDGDHRSGAHRRGVHLLHDLGVFDDALELTHPGIHLSLFLLGGVIIAVLREIAHLAGRLDPAGNVDLAASDEIVELGLESVEGLLGQLCTHPRRVLLTIEVSIPVSPTLTRRSTQEDHEMAHKVAVLGGDGIGPEVIAEALKVVAAAGITLDTTEYDLGGRRFLATGEILPDAVLAELRSFDAILLGAIGTPEVPPGVLERGLLLKLRFELDLYVNQRPFLYPANNVDCIVIRENTEGTYAGEGGFLRKGTPHEVATQGSVNTRMGVERCVRYAFELARWRPRHHLTLVHKTNVLQFAGDLWQRTFNEVAAEYGDVATAYNHVDAACIYFVDSPQRYDVIVTDNLFGDILTDLAGAVAGGVGLASSANLNPARTGPSMFEPVHGSAPDIVGTGKADPRAAIISAALMLDYLGEPSAAAKIRAAVERTVAAGSDMPTGPTVAIGDHIAANL